MTTVNIHEAKTHLSRLLERAHRGERIIIAKAGKPMVELTPIKHRTIVLGAHEGELDIDWDKLDEEDEAMDAEMAAYFSGPGEPSR